MILGILIGIGGIVGVIGSAIVMRFWAITIVVLSILKLVNLIQIPWFAGLFTISALGTGLWMLVIGLALFILSLGITGIGIAITDMNSKRSS